MNKKLLLPIAIAVILVVLIGIYFATRGVKGPEERPTGEEPTEQPTTKEPTEPTTIKQNDANSDGDVSAQLESPYPINYGEWKGTLTEDDDGDAYGIRWNPGDTLDIVITPSRGIDIAFYGAAGGDEIALRNAGVKGEPETIQMTGDITMNIKRADILIRAVSGSGNYVLNITKTPQNDGGKGQDAPREWDQPVVISAGKYEGCYLGSADDIDTYAIRVSEGQKVTIKAIPSTELDVALDTVGYGPLGQFSLNDNFKGEIEEVTETADEAGIYKFGVGKIGETKGTYTLEISVQ